MNIFDKLTLLVGSIFVILMLPASVLAATLTLNPSSGTFNRGCSVELKIELDTIGAQTDGTDAILLFPTSVFSTTVSQIVPNTSLYQDYPGNSVDNGKLTVSGLASTSKPFSSKGTLATITFTVGASSTLGPAKISFDFDPNDKSKTTDSNVVEHGTVVDLLASAPDGNYTIADGACSGSTSPAPSSGTSSGSTSGTGTGTKGGQGAALATPLPTKQPVLQDTGLVTPTILAGSVGLLLLVAGVLGMVFL
ncbi:hypothetical protein A2631_03715 [Candidatus Daviesbacteria bacterium RIFCSPHIGHO2_01_FULL_44_29]|uniref:Cohesin domain-containing protein n=1 Tax=Candidatus Daviesbacteria bacterium RIFCSPHIGHO2_02_FULL_43_12 TaxID=1797776 RepID=A0A1F5KHP7_9BACT|nr:MAG: hypothetical protein A2631_03715 [Candidatus Daviesbacteria bacterium RIFCSPHIGHO2_01_FULL_44_29]OGE40466.1 MAG: hypothetical protein A3D25_00175 [Candidatus Daviesbacteria bacterium RIFCSPHIGHO2_02_FULL_43_12]OGE70017.1 MAG: hypothetical protein A3B55_04980 [Candidatus Daviesbacteria bacterium RIFCSPLOWO2_01_FULL_43_15]